MTRFSTVMIAVVCLAAPAAQGADRVAELVVEGDVVCTYPNFVDHQVSTNSYSLVLPEIDGPVSAQGSYVNKGTGYTLAGPSVVDGKVRDDSELVLTHIQWSYNGEWMASAAPFVPTAGQPVSIPLDPGAQKLVEFQNVVHAAGTSCSGSIVYRLDFERETQVWDVALKADRQLLYKLLYGLYDSEKSLWSSIDYIHGATFHYNLAAQVTLERRRGAWQYREGEVTRASATFDYEQTPEIYKIIAQRCQGCDKVAAMKGAAIGGTSDGKTLTLYWPGIMPVAELTSRLALACAPGPRQASCERMHKDTSQFASEDDDTLPRARDHVLKLVAGTQTIPVGQDKRTGASHLKIDYRYTMSRVK